MAKASNPSAKKTTAATPKKVSAPAKPTGMGNLQQYDANTTRAKTTPQASRQYPLVTRQLQANARQADARATANRAMPDRSPVVASMTARDNYNRAQDAKVQAARNQVAADYTARTTAPTMSQVRQTDRAISQPDRAAQASAGRYNRQYLQTPDTRKAEQYIGYGSPSYGLTPYTGETAAGYAADAARYQAQADRYAKTTRPSGSGYGSNGGGGYGYGGGGGGGGGSSYTQTPEWYEKMINWKF